MVKRKGARNGTRTIKRYVVNARITMRSGPISKTEAEKLMRNTKKRAPNAIVTIKAV